MCMFQLTRFRLRIKLANNFRLPSSRVSTIETDHPCARSLHTAHDCRLRHHPTTKRSRLNKCTTNALDPFEAGLGEGALDDNGVSGSLGEIEPDVDEKPTPQTYRDVVPVKRTRKNDWALRAVLKVFVNKVEPNYAQPWQKFAQRSSTGSAFIIDIEKRWILTNAHVVDNATIVYVRRPGIPKKWKAEVMCMGKMCDLAILTVDEEGFWATGMRPLRIVDVPDLQSPIAVVGYPVGGDSLSVTKGIVSRITMARYSGIANMLGIQIDAAINPGNSGGPTFSDLEQGHVAGVAFSKNAMRATDNIGYIIPAPVVNHFLEEYRLHGTFLGICSLGIYTQPMENPYMRAQLKVPRELSGMVVSRVEPLSSAAGRLMPRDVVVEIDGVPVADDETVAFRDDERVAWTSVVQAKHTGDVLTLRVLRGGQELLVSVIADVRRPLVPLLAAVDCQPSYLVVAGLVFSPLTWPLLENVFGPKKWRQMVPPAVWSIITADRERQDQQPVMLVQVLSHEVNHGYRHAVTPLETFNDVAVQNLAHLAGMLDACSEPYLTFGLEGGRFITLGTQDARSATPLILSTNGVPADRSPDLQGLPPLQPAAQEVNQQIAAATSASTVSAGDSSYGHGGDSAASWP